MKTIFRITAILAVIILLAACQKTPTAATPSQPIAATPAPIDEPAATPTAAPADMDPASTGPTVQFNESYDPADFIPQIGLFSEPYDDTPFSVTLTCNGVESDAWPPVSGLLVNHHCIIQNPMRYTLLILPDGSIIGMGYDSRIQVNLSENIVTEVILEQGEIYNLVAPQGASRRYTILVGGVGIEAQGTRFGVSLKDKLINVVVFDGKVVTYRCLNWATYTCHKWDQVSVEFLPGYDYSNTFGELDWTKGNKYNPDNMVPDPTLPASRYFEPIFAKTIQYRDGSASGIYWDDENMATAYSHIQEFITSQVSDIALHDYMAGVLNHDNSTYCANWEGLCPMTTPTPGGNPFDHNPQDHTPVAGGDQPGSSGGSPSGKFPEFDPSSCFARGGHTWCFPKPGYADDTMSAEWDVTAICAKYPGETICSQIR